MLDKRKAVAFKVEAVEGTPETITAAEVLYAENIKFAPSTEMLKRNPHLATLSQEIPLPGRSYAKVSFDMPMFGSSAAGSAPHWSGCLRCCGFAETLVAVTSAKYLPATTSIPSATIKVFLDGISYQLKGCRGNVSRKNGDGDIPRLSFEFTGIWDPDVDVDAFKDESFLTGNAFPAFNPLAMKAALVSKDTTTYLISKALSWNMNNVIALEPSANVSSFKSVQITGRNPSGEIDAKAVLAATIDFQRLARRQTSFQLRAYTGASDSGESGTGALNSMTDATKNWITDQWNATKLVDSAGVVFSPSANTKTVLTVAGTPATGWYLLYTAGRLIRETMPKVTIQNVNEGNESGIAWNTLPFNFSRNSADDEIEIFII